MNRKRNKFDLQAETDLEATDDAKTRRLKRMAIIVAFLSTYYFFVKLLFL